MANGPYDDLTTYVLQQADAEVVVVIVLEGKSGSGWALAQHPQQAYTNVHARIPDILRALAEQIEVDQSHRNEARN